VRCVIGSRDYNLQSLTVALLNVLWMIYKKLYADLMATAEHDMQKLIDSYNEITHDRSVKTLLLHAMTFYSTESLINSK
jgi:hypothetical protein